jgi:DNA (cytosine-5)-methyltransferase 1
MPTYGSLFAGVGGFDIGFDNAGWECGFQVEWDKHCQQVLTHHWPEVPKWWDVSEVNGAELPPVDLITFGSPCQDLSLAGKRAGLMEGSRSNLFFEATRIIKEMRDATNGQYPRWAIWENVAGAFSSNKGADFDAVLQEMVDIGGHHVEWHCMDAQFYGVPQRRRRVFVIACFDPSILERGGQALLPVSEGRRRNTSARNKERKALASTLGKSFDSGSGRLNKRVEAELPWAAGSTDDDVLTKSVTSKWHKGTGGPSGSEHYNLVVEPVSQAIIEVDPIGTLQSRGYKGVNHEGARDGHLVVEPMLIDGTRVDDVRIYESPVQTLMSRMGTGGNNVPMVAIDDAPVLMRQRKGKPGGGKGPLLSDTSLTLAGSNDQVLFQPSAIGFSHTQGLDAQPSEETFPTLRVGGAGQAVAIPIDTRNALRDPDKHDAVNRQGLGVGKDGDPSPTITNAFVPAVATDAIPIDDVREIEKHQNGTGIGNAGDPAYTLDTMSASGVAVSYTPTSFAQYTEGVGTLKANGGDLGGGSESLIVETDIAPTLRSGGDGGVPSSRGEHLVVEAYDEYNDALGGHVHQALRAGTKQSTGVLADMVVRRLTPVECERLMGWPDNHTLYRADGTTNSDTTRYKMCGNGVASPVAQWIAEHLLEFHTAL